MYDQHSVTDSQDKNVEIKIAKTSTNELRLVKKRMKKPQIR